MDAVLDSTFLHLGDRLRVSVNLLRVEDGASLWAERFDERFTDIFAIQDKVSQQVAQRLRLRLSPAAAGAAHQTLYFEPGSLQLLREGHVSLRQYRSQS